MPRGQRMWFRGVRIGESFNSANVCSGTHLAVGRGMRTHSVSSLAMLLLAACFGSDASESSSSVKGGNGNGGTGGGGGVRGAIFTTTVDGTVVNANHFSAKSDVYLDGGPGENAPSKAAALAAGDYYFQVTDPSGKHLLSTDDIECRRIRVSSDGVIVEAYPGPNNCGHATGVDADYGASLGAITVQLMPYADTPNNGGVYKVWVTPVEHYDGKFKNKYSKTDNFKVAPGAPPPPPPTCGDGHVDSGEECDDGNNMNGDGCSAGCTNEPEPCCGDGHLDAGEECDDGNTTDGDGCSATCTTESGPTCGDGHVDDTEACDDGNTTSGDGCSAECEPEKEPCCGDGVIDAGEQCDDGNTIGGDGCSSTCQHEMYEPYLKKE